jgi:hypothetical protein
VSDRIREQLERPPGQLGDVLQQLDTIAPNTLEGSAVGTQQDGVAVTGGIRVEGDRAGLAAGGGWGTASGWWGGIKGLLKLGRKS